MTNLVNTEGRAALLVTLSMFAAIAVLALAPVVLVTNAGERSGDGLVEQTLSHDPEFPNYDIRTDKAAYGDLAGFRERSGKNASAVADIRDGFAMGEERLRASVPSLKIEYNPELRTPEIISPEVRLARESLTGPSSEKRPAALKRFLSENADLIGVPAEETADLKVAADYTNPDGNLSFVILNQEIDGIPVFRGEAKAGFSKDGEIIRIINNLAPGIDQHSVSREFGDPASAVRTAASYIGHELRDFETSLNAAASNELKVVLGEGDSATTAEKMYFPTEPGVAVPAWRVLVWLPVNAYYVIVDAETGTMLWRKNITEDQTQSAAFDIYANPPAMMLVADSPAPLSPGPVDPTTGTQGPLGTRSSVTLIGNEAPYAFNNSGWITDGANHTDGNAVEAGIDRDGTDGVDAPQPGDGPCPGAGCRTFTSTWNPPPGNPPPGQSPLDPQAQRGAVIQMFNVMNRYHDEMYRLGFTEPAFNFQNNNFGRGGLGNDRVRAEGQDSSGTNNANFSTPADGGRGRMQMYIWTAPNPDRDGTADAEIVIHEVTHGTSNRLHGNAAGLTTNMSRAMGEGWSDFYAHAMLSEPSDPINGVYALGGYSLFDYYYGIRRFPKAVMAFTGGPLNRPHNPMTFADIDSTQINLTNGAFPAAFTGTADQVHNAGEVWSSALWEVRARYVQRLGWADGNRRALQHITDGMKLAPIGPTFLTERDAILAAALFSGTAADVADIWAGFAIRGMGFSASIQNPGTGTGTARVTEAFDLPNLLQTPALTISDAGGDGDGFPEPGEPLSITLPLTNNTGNTATGVNVQLVGGGSADYGSIANGQTVSRQISYTVPAATACGTTLDLTFNATSNLGPTSFVRSMTVGEPVVTFSENFDGVAAPGLPAGWTAVPVLGALNFATVTTSADTAPNSVYANDPAAGASGTDLTSPSIAITAPAASLSFRHRFDTEAAWDGGVVEISIGAGPFTDIISAGGTWVTNGYNSLMTAASPSPTYTPNPLNGRNGWTGNSGGFITTVVTLPPSAAGQNVRLKWRFGADDNTTGTGPNPGWYVDTVVVQGDYSCTIINNSDAPFDFDGDGKTDVSIFRPSVGEWWYLRSSDGGNFAAQFGAETDVIVPGDYTGDGKADFAFFRPSTGEWFVLRSEDFSFYAFPFGTGTDIPAPADYDGDGRTDPAVFRPSTGTWFIVRSSDGQVTITSFGTAGDQPVAGDFDGDGSADIAIFRPNGTSGAEWWIQRSTDGLIAAQFGQPTDKPAVGDYTGDGKTDMALWRPSTGEWFVLRSEDFSFYAFPFGTTGDLPAPGDYDGDGTTDPAVFRPSSATWFMQGSTSGTVITPFGQSGDRAVPNAYVR